MHELLSNLLATLGIALTEDALLTATALLAFLLGLTIAGLIAGHRQRRLRDQHRQEQDARQQAEQARFDDQIDHLGDTFSALSQQALRQNNDAFLMLAKQNFEQLRVAASGDLQAREQSFANLVKPIEQSLRETDLTLKKLDAQRQVSEARLGEQISNLLGSHASLQSETRNLVSALRRPEVRGQWGELTLRRLVELAGMSEHCDYQQQTSVQTDDGVLRPDMIIHLPAERQLVVDVKTPLDAYISASEASDVEQQKAFLVAHSRNVKNRIKELALKKYWNQFATAPDFIILFIPGDQFLGSALEHDQQLLEFALERRILLATPTSLVGLLRAIAYGWNQDTLSKNSSEIKNLGETLYTRLTILTEHINRLGRSLQNSNEQFNKLVGSFESKTLPAARKLASMGISSDQQPELDNPAPTTLRQAAAAPTDPQHTATTKTPDQGSN